MQPTREKFLIVGSGGRESAFALSLAKESDISIYAVIDHKNPTIIDCVEKTAGQYLVENTTDAQAIVRFAKQCKIDYAFVNADAPLANGVVDELLGNGIKAVGGTQKATRIEWDKVYSIELMNEVCPEFTPFYRIVSSQQELASAINDFKNEKLAMVVKPQGLTGGKGVKVMGEHLNTYQDSMEYAASLLEQNEKAKVLLVEKLDGIEFTVMGFTDGKTLLMSPASYDYPYREEGDTGPGTGGMGCFTANEERLPFMDEVDFANCRTIMERIILSLAEKNNRFKGILNGGFFKTSKGIRFMEFNSRFGDPEGLNILSILKTSFANIIKDIYNECLVKDSVQFLSKASVIKYLVAEEYPEVSDKEIEFTVNEQAIKDAGIQLYYASCVRSEANNTYVTLKKSRVLALGMIADDIAQAADLINQAIDNYVRSALVYRRDIASPEHLEKLDKINQQLV